MCRNKFPHDKGEHEGNPKRVDALLEILAEMPPWAGPSHQQTLAAALIRTREALVGVLPSTAYGLAITKEEAAALTAIEDKELLKELTDAV